MSESFLTSEAIGPELGVRYLPVMIGRLMLSLRKAASLQGDAWSFGLPTTNIGMRFAERRGPDATGDETHLDSFFGGREGTQSRV